MKTRSVLLAVLAGAGLLAAAPAMGGYHLLQSVTVPDDQGADYCIVDSPARRVYFSHSTRVLVLDADTAAVVGSIEKTDGVHGIALAPDLGRGFTSNGRANSSTIFDLKTLKTIGEVKVTGNTPDAIIYDPATKRVFTFNKQGLNSTVIDGAAGTVAGTIDLQGNPEFAASDAKGHVFVDLVDKDVVLQIDSRDMKAESRWPTAPCQKPGTMAIDRKNGRLFVGCGNQMLAVLDSETGKVVATVPIGPGRDAAQFDPGTHFVFSSNGGDGTVTVIHQESADKYTVVENAKTETGARTMAVDLNTHKIFLPNLKRLPPPAPTPDNPRPRGAVAPGSFHILILGM